METTTIYMFLKTKNISLVTHNQSAVCSFLTKWFEFLGMFFVAQHTRSRSSAGRQIHTPKGGAYLVTYCILMHGPQRGAPSCQTWDTAAWHHTHFAAGLKQHGLYTVQHAARGLLVPATSIKRTSRPAHN